MNKKYKTRRTFSDRLKEDLKNPIFRKSFDRSEVTARIAIAVALLRKK